RARVDPHAHAAGDEKADPPAAREPVRAAVTSQVAYADAATASDAGSGFRTPTNSGWTRRSSGVVAIVVAKAISTSMANSVGEINPRSRPMLSTISSISPRVFMSTPSAAAVRPSSPARRAEAQVPPNLPIVATTVIRPQTSQADHPDTSPI